jgi:hypothetical protein
MGVSEKDRAYFRRIGSIKQTRHENATAAHDELSIDERLRESVALFFRFRDVAGQRADDPAAYYERARALGLYNG